MAADPKRGINQHTESTTSTTANTWTEIFPSSQFRNFLFVQNLSSTDDIDIGYGNSGAEKLLKRLSPLDIMGFSIAEGLPSERIVVRSSGTSIPFVAWEK
jgi:hypothetical protein